MPIRLGETEPMALYLGDTEITKAYLGEIEVYSSDRLDTRDGVRVTSAQRAQNPYYGYWPGAGYRGTIENQANSRVIVIRGARRSWNPPFIFAWTGQPTSGTVYGRWSPDSGDDYDFTLSYNFPHGGWLSSGSVFPPNGVWNAASGLPTGTFYFFSDAARTQIISMRGRQ